MPNIFTRVPDTPPPTLDRVGWLIGVADFGMKLFLSTPRSGTLRTTWITPGTLSLAWLTTIAFWVVAALLARAVHPTPAGVALAAVSVFSTLLGVLTFAIGSVGILQRTGQ